MWQKLQYYWWFICWNIVFAKFLLVCFVNVRESTCETRKNIFYFTSKALLVLGIIKFWLFRYSNLIMSSNAQEWNKKHILLNNLGSKHSVVMKFGQFIQCYKRKFFIKKLYKKCGLETSSRPFFNFQRILCKKKSEKVCNLIWTNFDSLSTTYLM